MTQNELDVRLALHEAFLNKERGGKKMRFSEYGEDLSFLDFSGSDIRGVDFISCNLEGSSFNGSNIMWSSFKGAGLAGAKFLGANVDFVDFSLAKMSGTNLTGVDLSSCYLRFATLDRAIISDTTKFPFATPHVNKHLKSEILRKANPENGTMCMGNWRTKDFLHCIFHWAIELSGKQGHEIQEESCGHFAARLLLGLDQDTMVLFAGDNDKILDWLQN